VKPIYTRTDLALIYWIYRVGDLMIAPKDEIVFIAKNKGWESGLKLQITDNTKKEEIAYVLFEIADQCYEHLYDYAEIDSKKVIGIAKEYAKDCKDLKSVSKLKPTKIKNEVVEHCKSPVHYRLAESLFNKTILEELGIKLMPEIKTDVKKIRTEVREYEEVVFIAKHGDWIMIKKLLIEPKLTKQEEVSLILASIYNTIVDKAFEYLGVDVQTVEEECETECKGLKKGFDSIAVALKKADDASAIYYNREVCKNLGKKVMFENELLQKVYPDLKIPKPRGNYAGKKKKKK
jgi:hypothetical protein